MQDYLDMILSIDRNSIKIMIGTKHLRKKWNRELQPRVNGLAVESSDFTCSQHIARTKRIKNMQVTIENPQWPDISTFGLHSFRGKVNPT